MTMFCSCIISTNTLESLVIFNILLNFIIIITHTLPIQTPLTHLWLGKQVLEPHWHCAVATPDPQVDIFLP